MLSLDLRDYRFDLPEELIAQNPLEKRSDSRLLVVRSRPQIGEASLEDRYVRDLPDILASDSRLRNPLLVRNQTRVFPARFFGIRKSSAGGEAIHEIVLTYEKSPGLWQAMIRNQKKLRFPHTLRILGRTDCAVLVTGPGEISTQHLLQFREILEEVGEMPLPPYIKTRQPERDRERYQSVWSRQDQARSAAAPTASLHFDEPLIARLEKQGATFCNVNLDVGLGTFEPVRTRDLSTHKLHQESFEVTCEAWQLLHDSRAKQRPIICIGTTALRTVESLQDSDFSKDPETSSNAIRRDTKLFIRPGHQWRFPESHLLTNFHLPESTLFVLVATFANSLELAKAAYQHAIRQRYRFFSYGDATLWIR